MSHASYDHSPKGTDQRGVAVAAIVALVAFALLLGVSLYFTRSTPSDNGSMEDDAMMEQTTPSDDDAMMEDDTMMDDEGMMEDDDAIMEDDEAMMEDDAMTDDGNGMMEDEGMMETSSLELTGTIIAGGTAELRDFVKADYDAAVASDKLVVLYFYANWCPVCKAETKSALYPAFDALSDPNVIGFRVNYNDSDTDDAERALAKEFGVAYQHTKVFVKNGKRILKSPESWTTDRYLSEIVANK